jgi:quinoprotein glucose dehydrogenase
MEELAAMAGKPLLPEAIAFRALAANFRLGEPAHAARLVAFASRTSEPDHLRVTAMKLLADWKTPPRRDPITGLRLELPARPTDAAGAAVKASLDSLLKGSDALRSATVHALTKLNVEGVGASLLAMVKDVQRPTSVRVSPSLVPAASASTSPNTWCTPAIRLRWMRSCGARNGAWMTRSHAAAASTA